MDISQRKRSFGSRERQTLAVVEVDIPWDCALAMALHYAHYYGVQPPDDEDIAQEAIIDIWRLGYDGQPAIIKKCVHDRALSYRRKERQNFRLSPDFYIQDEGMISRLEAVERLEEIRQFLPRAEWEAVIRYTQGVSAGSPSDRTRTCRARQKMRDHFAGSRV